MQKLNNIQAIDFFGRTTVMFSYRRRRP